MSQDPLISVVLPAYNEASVLEELCGQVMAALEGKRAEVVFVNDGSSDDSGRVMDTIAAADSRIKVVHLSRNFGHQAAILAGLQHADGDAVVLMDADLQDDPRALPKLVDKWQEGFEVVYAMRVGRKEGPFKRLLFFLFYRFLNRFTRTPQPADAGNFGLLDRRVCRLLCEASDQDRYYPGLRHWMGFRQTGVVVERQTRYDGKPRVTLRALFSLAKSAVFSFSTFPATFFYLIAALSVLVFVGLAGGFLYLTLAVGAVGPAWMTTVLVASFFGALNALGIAVLGDYVSRIYDQVRGRPHFIVDRTVNLQSKPAVVLDRPASSVQRG